AADTPPPRCAHVPDAWPHGGRTRPRRAARIPVGERGDDLRSLRLRARVDDRRDDAVARPRALRGALRATRRRPAGRRGGGGEALPAAVRAGVRAAAGAVRT